MQSKAAFNSKLRAFDREFDSSLEDIAAQVRGEFLRKYPLDRIRKMTIDKYIIGKKTPSFCKYVEQETKPWANILGATSFKFGIYYGRTSSNPRKTYRFVRKKFGNNKFEAFRAVKAHLLDLIKTGRERKFSKIDQNPLSQMFKAKILSLYFPEIYLNVCSAEHIKLLARKIGIRKCRYISEYQYRLARRKRENRITRNWSNPKFMIFLYDTFKPKGRRVQGNIVKEATTKHRRVNFEDIEEWRRKVGKASEGFARKWERKRLNGLFYKIIDRREMPSYGYDFLSRSGQNERYIEVKTATKTRGDKAYRFYLSENQLAVSKSRKCAEQYYFYLVYRKNGKPYKVEPRKAGRFYESTKPVPCEYMIRFITKLRN